MAGKKPSHDKEIVIGIRQRGGSLRMFHAQDVRGGTLARYIRQNVSQDLEVFMTDDYSGYKRAVKMSVGSAKHRTINHSSRVYVTATFTLEQLIPRSHCSSAAITGTWHSISAKHLQAYLDEMNVSI